MGAPLAREVRFTEIWQYTQALSRPRISFSTCSEMPYVLDIGLITTSVLIIP